MCPRSIVKSERDPPWITRIYAGHTSAVVSNGLYCDNLARGQSRSPGRVEKPGEALSIEKTIQLSVPIYRHKMDVDYERPSPDELRNHFRNLDLEGDFWAI